MTTPRIEEIIRQTHTFLPLDLEGREEYLQYLEQALTQAHQAGALAVIGEVKQIINMAPPHVVDFNTLSDGSPDYKLAVLTRYLLEHITTLEQSLQDNK